MVVLSLNVLGWVDNDDGDGASSSIIFILNLLVASAVDAAVCLLYIQV